MLLTKLLADDEAKTDAFVIQVVHILQFTKLLEELFLVFLAYAYASVLHLDQYLFFFP